MAYQGAHAMIEPRVKKVAKGIYQSKRAGRARRVWKALGVVLVETARIVFVSTAVFIGVGIVTLVLLSILL